MLFIALPGTAVSLYFLSENCATSNITLCGRAGIADSVSLNRGNHEDFSVCCAYGFKAECCKKYDDVTFGMFVEVFNYIPMFAIVNSAVFVTHGGLFHCPDVTLEELNSIKRFEFSLKDLPDGGEGALHIPREQSVEFLKQLQRDALWSDPMDSNGLINNPRGMTFTRF